MLITIPVMVLAQENVYYTNEKGATLTEEQYNYLIDYFDEDTLYTMTVEQIDLIKDNRNLTVTTETKYVRTDEVYDTTGVLLEVENTEVTEDEALNY